MTIPRGAPTGARRVVAVVPLKAVSAAKTRMAPALSPADRTLLLQRSLERVVAALRGASASGAPGAAAALPDPAAAIDRVIVLAGDDRGAAWARRFGAEVLREPEGLGGLNDALAHADAVLGDAATLVVPADLPLVSAADILALLGAAPDGPAVVVAPTTDGGTGGLLRRPGGVIQPCFGVASAAAHVEAAAAAGVQAVTVHLPGMALDLDRPGDIDLAGGWPAVVAPVGEPARDQGYPPR